MIGYYTDLAEKLSAKNRIDGSDLEYISFITSAIKELAVYLDENNLELTIDSVSCWLKEWIVPMSDSKLIRMRGLINRVTCSVRHNLEVTHLFSEIDDSIYNHIPDWGKRLLDEFLFQFIKSGKYWPEKRKWVSDFLAFAIEHGFDGNHIVNSCITSAYYCAKGKTLPGVFNFISFLISLGLASSFSDKAYTPTIAKKVAVYNTILLPVETGEEFTMEKYIEAVECLIKASTERGYSNTALKRIKLVTADFGIFLENVRRGFSLTAVNKFLEVQDELDVDTNSRKFILMSINDILHGIPFDDLPSSYVEHRAFPVWCHPAVDEYEAIRRKNHLKESSLKTDEKSFLRFCDYFDAIGIKSFNEIDRQQLKDFNIQDVHGTAAGKARFNLRIKAFLKFLYEEGYTSLDLSLSLSSVPAVRVRPPVILTEEEVTAVNEYAENSATLRDKAILKIAMQTGLRAVDISNLTFEVINWDEKVFNIMQVKTGVEIRVPFSNGVGNALYEYITKERPDVKSNFIFINARAPFRPCNKTVVSCVLGKVFGMESRGAHIIRKTFASKLTISEPFPIIAEALGHSNTESLAPYLSIDAKRLKECALRLDDAFAYKGERL